MHEYSFLIKGDCKTIQVGDMGVGLSNTSLLDETYMNGKNRFIRGNHDNLQKCKNYKSYITDGAVEILDNGTKIMYIGGAYSIDKDSRIPDLDWFYDEELTYNEWITIFEIYEKIKPNVLVTHDCPNFLTKPMFNKEQYIQNKNITSQALGELYEIHSPDMHIFGHWHISKKMKLNGTEFVCVGEKEIYEVFL
jgi:predicted phosphodiesterase